jgi:hypothetical protein
MAPLAAETVTSRVSRGDLTIPETTIQQIGGGPLTDAVRDMVQALVRLVGAIRTSADESAALGEEISAATEQMSASTQEVAGTTAELTDRATRETAGRSVADDAERILTIAQEPAGACRRRNGTPSWPARPAIARLHASASRRTSSARRSNGAPPKPRTSPMPRTKSRRSSPRPRNRPADAHLSLNAAIEAARAGVTAR